MSIPTAPVRLAVTREMLVAYAAASGDDNPIHQSDEAARAIGLPGVIAHGMWTMGAALGVLERPVAKTRCRFSQPVVVPTDGTVITVTAVEGEPDAEGHDTARVEAHNEAGERVIAVEVTFA